MATPKMNQFNKSLKSFLASEKKHDRFAALEYEMAFQNNNQRGKVWNQSEINASYPRRNGDAAGATKVCHLMNHNGEKFRYIVIKRYKQYGWDGCGSNQLIQEIDCWQKLANTDAADCLCPILKYFTSKSDKVSECSDTMKRNVVIIAQKAVCVSNAREACYEAERRNRDGGFHGESARNRYEKLRALANEQSWWDAMNNGGNSGVIFDYSKNCYKAVFIDYAL